ncbi:DNA-binding protein [Dactylosporangium sp. NPDC048998]|uniref:DNA-binding protein n=1 Tax=Dactylosporangium sp. NPDC048998 TaxID=3363976 RepID=UPI003712B85B
MHEGSDDQSAGAVEQWARDRLSARGGTDLPRLPWLADGQPHDAFTLIRQALWRANTDRGTLELPDDLLAAIALLAAARAELDQLEAGLLFVARAEGLTWAQVARPLGLRTAQAAQQRHERVLARLGEDAGS